MTLKAEKKEHKEHQKALKPLLKHLREDEIKLLKKESSMAHPKKAHSKEMHEKHHKGESKEHHNHGHKLTHAEEKLGGENSHAHHHKMAKHHLGELMKMAKGHNKKK